MIGSPANGCSMLGSTGCWGHSKHQYKLLKLPWFNLEHCFLSVFTAKILFSIHFSSNWVAPPLFSPTWHKSSFNLLKDVVDGISSERWRRYFREPKSLSIHPFRLSVHPSSHPSFLQIICWLTQSFIFSDSSVFSTFNYPPPSATLCGKDRKYFSQHFRTGAWLEVWLPAYNSEDIFWVSQRAFSNLGQETCVCVWRGCSRFDWSDSDSGLLLLFFLKIGKKMFLN